jgi:hypothetical protein
MIPLVHLFYVRKERLKINLFEPNLPIKITLKNRQQFGFITGSRKVIIICSLVYLMFFKLHRFNIIKKGRL